ncbi:MAG: hypothetical protein Q8P17_02115 [bacterium]|nr:hypothetical protein [bacterium]
MDQTSLHGDGIWASIDVLDFERSSKSVRAQEKEAWKWGALLHYHFETSPTHSRHREDDVTSEDNMTVSVFTENDKNPEKSVLDGIADILENWRVCELGFPDRLYGEERFDGRISRRGNTKNNILVNGLSPAHPIVLSYLTQSLGRFCGRWNIHRENHGNGLCAEIVDQALDSFFSRYGALVTQAQKQQMNHLFGER